MRERPSSGVCCESGGRPLIDSCLHFVAQSLGMGVLSSALATVPEMLGWYVLTFTEKSASARMYHCSISPGSIQVSLFIFSQGMARLCKDIY